jgi:hypothetical protein
MRTAPFRRLAALALLCACPVALAQEGAEAASPDAKLAQDLVTRYLQAVKAKKWPDAKKFLHPDTLKVIAERKKRLGREDHPMAPWTFEKTEFYLKDFKVSGVKPGPVSTYFVETSEDNYQVEEKGVAEGDTATYLVGRKGGKWYVVDKKRNETFTAAAVKVGYKNYFDAADPSKAEEE